MERLSLFNNDTDTMHFKITKVNLLLVQSIFHPGE